MSYKVINLFLMSWIFCVFHISSHCVNGAFESTQQGLKPVKFPKSMPQAKHGVGAGLDHGRDHASKKHRRGIILVDEDFDVPAKPGIKHGWGENEDLAEKTIFEIPKEKEKFLTDEGSGLSEMTRDSEYEYTESTLPAKQKKTEKPPSVFKSSPITPLLMTTELEGSGDASTSSTTPKPTKELPVESIPDVCLNTTCNPSDLFVDSAYEGFIPEGENLTLLCKTNQSAHETLYTTLLWYRVNESAYTLQALDRRMELRYDVHNVKVMHSGTYLCVKFENVNSCCHNEIFITVYEVPAYQYHLIIIGLITAASLITCIFLAIWRNIALKKYTKQFAKMQSNQKPLLI